MEFQNPKVQQKSNNTKANEIRFQKVSSLIEDQFKKNKIPQNEFFDEKIWFLSNDKSLRNILKNNQLTSKNSLNKSNFSETPLPLSKFHEILAELNESNSPSKIQINSSIFIEKISEEILSCFDLHERSQDLINQYKAHEMKNIIEQNRHKLKSRNQEYSQQKFSEKYSKIFFVVKNTTNFPKGNFLVESEFFELCDKESDRSTANTGKTFNSGNTGLGVVFENKKSFFINKKIEIQKDGTFVNLINQKEKKYYKIEDFEFKKFQIDERDVKINNTSGTSLQKIKINFFKENGDLLGFFTKNFIVLLLMNIEKIADTLHDDLSVSLSTRLECDEDNSDYRVELDFFMKFDTVTRLSILDTILKILENVVDMNTLYHNNLFEIYSYFPEIQEEIHQMLSEKNEKNASCNDCEIL